MPLPPNIIICLCDQLRSSEVGCYGNRSVRTPNIDALAAESVRFESGISPYPVCMAARSALLSGQYPRRCTGGVGNVVYTTEPGDCAMPEYPHAGRPHLPDATLPELLHQAGYYNAAIGKWHIHTWPQDIGFDEYTIPRVHHCHSGQSFTRNGGPEFVPDGWSVDFEADEVEAFLDGRAKEGRPFFLYYNISPPHCPVADAPEQYRTMYRPEDIELRPNVDESAPLANQDYWFKVYRWDFRYYAHHLPYTEQLPPGYSLRHLIAEYRGVVAWVDDAVGRMLRNLSRRGLDKNTIVVFTADHGDNLGSHGRVQKGSFNEEAIAVPLVIRWPGSPRGQVVSDQVASLVDLMPTLLEAAGVEVPGHVHGQSLMPLLDGRRQRLDRDHAFIETPVGIAIRTPTHIYALPWTQPGGGPRAGRPLSDATDYFFDLRADPCQLRALPTDGESASLARDLDSRLRDWHRQARGAD